MVKLNKSYVFNFNVYEDSRLVDFHLVVFAPCRLFAFVKVIFKFFSSSKISIY